MTDRTSVARTLALALLGAAVSGCAVGHPAPSTPSGAPASRSLAVPAQLLPRGGALATSGPPVSGAPGASGGTSTAGATTSVTTRPGTPAGAFGLLARVPDRTGDAGPAAPAYGDIVAVTVESDAGSARLTVQVAGALPDPVARNEVMGIGVDIYKADTRESDYQVFADGEPDGWFAYLDTPTGFVRYPGSLGVGGGEVVFTLPWSAVANLGAGRVSAFVDWSRAVTAAATLDSSDRAPDTGSARWSR